MRRRRRTGPSPTELLELATAHQRSKVLASLIELDIPSQLGDGPRCSEAIAASLHASPLAIGLLLETAVALGVLRRGDGGFANTEASTRFLRRGSKDYLGDLFLRHDRMASSRAWSEFPQRLRAWRAGASGVVAEEAAPTAAERDGQHHIGMLAGEALGEALDLSHSRLLLDLGGGTGAMSIALCRRYSRLGAAMIERSEVAAVAYDYVRKAGLAGRIEVCTGDFLAATPWPAGADVVLLANVLSLLAAETGRELMARVFAYLPPGGTVVLSGWMPAPGIGLGPLLLGLEDIALGAPDVERPADQYAMWLAQAGFGELEQAVYFAPTSLVAGRKPS